MIQPDPREEGPRQDGPSRQPDGQGRKGRSAKGLLRPRLHVPIERGKPVKKETRTNPGKRETSEKGTGPKRGRDSLRDKRDGQTVT